MYLKPKKKKYYKIFNEILTVMQDILTFTEKCFEIKKNKILRISEWYFCCIQDIFIFFGKEIFKNVCMTSSRTIFQNRNLSNERSGGFGRKIRENRVGLYLRHMGNLGELAQFSNCNMRIMDSCVYQAVFGERFFLLSLPILLPFFLCRPDIRVDG